MMAQIGRLVAVVVIITLYVTGHWNTGVTVWLFQGFMLVCRLVMSSP